MQPRRKENGEWRDIAWDDALEHLAESLRAADADKTAILASPSSTLEECHLLARIADRLGTANLDHRLRRQDFSDQDADPVFPWLGCDIADIENADAILVAGSNLRREVPIIAHRVRKAALGGSKVCFANPLRYDYRFDVAAYAADAGLVKLLAGIAVATGVKLPDNVSALCKGVVPDDDQASVARQLVDADNGLVLLGHLAGRHGASAAVRALAAAIADGTGSRLGVISEGANTAGAHLAGVLPHRESRGQPRNKPGQHAAGLMKQSLDAVVLCGIEPDLDIIQGDAAVQHLAQQRFVVALTPYRSYALDTCSDLMLPIGTFLETSGTYVNCEGRWQSFQGVASPVGEARPAWKVLRVLANLLGVEDSEYESSTDVLDELRQTLGAITPDNSARSTARLEKANGADDPSRQFDIPMYSVDAVVRRAVALQLTPEARRGRGEAA